MTRQYHLNEAARLVGVRAWRISYAISQGYLPEVSRLSNQRIFTDADIVRIRRYFAKKSNKGRPAKEEHE
jgi:hypothetical protein